MKNNNKPHKAVWDSCLDKTSKTKSTKTNIVNKKYINNLDIVRKNIDKGNSEETLARKKLSKYIIK